MSGKGVRMSEKVEGRAWEPYQKKQVTDRLLALWERNPELRLGQLIANVVDGTDMYYEEDLPLIGVLEEFYQEHG